MLRRLALRDFVIVPSLEVDFDHGFSVLTGETGAGKSILVDALQLALGGRGDALVVREGSARAEISAEFDTPAGLDAWLDEAGFERGEMLLLRRVVDAGGKSRAWVNGSAATVAQLREAADALVEIHGQHAWQSLTRPAAVRSMLDARAGVDGAALAAAFGRWKAALEALEAARSKQGEIERERERLAWQIGEIDKLAPAPDEWDELNAEHQRLSNAQSLIDAARGALDLLSEDDDNAARGVGRAIDALDAVARFDSRLAAVVEVLRGAQAQLDDAAHTLSGYLGHLDLEPERLAELDARLSAWMSLARRWRRPPAELPQLHAQWKVELQALEAAADLGALAEAAEAARARLRSARTRRQRCTRQGGAEARRRRDAGDAAARHGRRALRRCAGRPGRTAVVRRRVGRVAGGRPRRQHAAAAGQSGLGRRAVAHRAGHRRHDRGARPRTAQRR